MALWRTLLISCTVFVLLDTAVAVLDCSQLNPRVTDTDCKEYAAYGAADVAIVRLSLSQFDDGDRELFRVVLANVSNLYYPSIKIEPENIAIVELFENREGVLILSFFVMNPSGSTFFPILFRTKELHLMMDLNLDEINQRLPYTIDPIAVEDDYPLFFPVWAIVIMIYLVIVIFVFLIYLACRNWNDEKSGSIDIESEEADPVKKSYTSYSYDEQDYSIINRKTTSDPVKDDLEYDLVENNNTKDSAMQTPRTVAMQVRPNDIDTTIAVIETPPDAVSKKSDVTSDVGEVNDGYVNNHDDEMGTQVTTF